MCVCVCARVCVCVCATVFNRVFHLSVFVHFRLYKQREPLRVLILRESFKNLQNVVMKIIFVKFQKCGGKSISSDHVSGVFALFSL